VKDAGYGAVELLGDTGVAGAVDLSVGDVVGVPRGGLPGPLFRACSRSSGTLTGALAGWHSEKSQQIVLLSLRVRPGFNVLSLSRRGYYNNPADGDATAGCTLPALGSHRI